MIIIPLNKNHSVQASIPSTLLHQEIFCGGTVGNTEENISLALQRWADNAKDLQGKLALTGHWPGLKIKEQQASTQENKFTYTFDHQSTIDDNMHTLQTIAF